MSKRRPVLKSMGILAAAALQTPVRESAATVSQSDDWFMPDEAAPHQRTWMAFGASRAIWGEKLLPEVQRNLASIALAIARYEPVSMLVRQKDMTRARELMGSNVELLVCPHDDLWMRDTGPVFVVKKNSAKGEAKKEALAGVDFNFNGWGAKQAYQSDRKVAQFVTRQAAAEPLQTGLILEGGGIEADGEGTAIITESCVLNDNRNPGMSKTQCERELKRLLGLKTIIWLPGVKGKDITDGHTDFYARFIRPGVVAAGYDPDPKSFDHAVTRKHLEILRTALDSKGRRLEVRVLEAPATVRDEFSNKDFAAGYLNFYVCNGAVIAPEFGDRRADAAARRELQSAYPDRDIVQINIDGIAAGGGGIHCTTQQEPKVF